MKNSIYRTFILITSLIAISCGDNTKETTEREAISDDRIKLTKAQFEQNNMELGTLSEKEFPVIVKATGMIDVPPENRSVVSATMGGYIKTLPLLIGDVVKKGQAILTIENPEFVTLQQEYMEVRQQLDYLKSEYDRQKIMFDENITSQKSYLKAESEYKTAQAKATGFHKQLEMLNFSPAAVEAGNIASVTTIYAPISGSVTEVNVTKGSYVAPATAILEIIDNSHIHLELSVFEKDIMKVKKDQNITFKIPEASPDSFEAEVHLVGTVIGEGRTIKVHGHLREEEKNHFLTGMFVEANIITATARAKALPDQSVVNVGNKNFVLVLDSEADGNYYLKQMEVEVKDNYNGYSLIENAQNYKPTDQFLIQGAFNLLGE